VQIYLLLRIVLIYYFPMIICVCKNVNSRQLKECLAKGMSLDDISEQMGLGTGCGRCLEYACSVAEKEAPLIATETVFA